MIVCERIADLRDRLRAERRAGRTVGFVPTMGALHDGHLTLVERARAENDVVVVSVFVNPAQFGPGEDFDAYPRPLAHDLARCESAGVDYVFAPSVREMYSRAPAIRVVVQGLTETMEGAHRPGHFDGVALVVAKLLNVVGECRAYFGEKDAQQVRVVRRMVDDLDMPAEIVACPTVRDDDGLALSSRNAYLSPDERERALCLPRALKTIADLVEKGERDAGVLLERGREVLAEGQPDAVDYLECVDPDDLRPLSEVHGRALVAGAVRIGRTRLIDNVTVQAP